MEKRGNLSAISKRAVEDDTVRCIYKQSFAKALSDVAAFNKKKLSFCSDRPSQRFAAEYVMQYLVNHEMTFTVESLERESNNHFRRKHTERKGTDQIKPAQDNDIIERLLKLYVSRNSAAPLGSPAKPQLSPPPKSDQPFSSDCEQSGASATRKIRVKVRKGKDGRLLEDPRSIVMSDQVHERISKKDTSFLYTTTRVDSNSPTKQAAESSSKHNRHQQQGKRKEMVNELEEGELKTFNLNGETTIDSDSDREIQRPAPKLEKPPQSFEYDAYSEDKYPDLKPVLISAKLEPDDSHQSDIEDCLDIEESNSTLSYIDRIRMQLRNEIENNAKEIEMLKEIIREKEKEESP
jgi:hypothetical protein